MYHKLAGGKFSTLYNDFESYIKQYFNFSGELNELFSTNSNSELNGNFDINSLFQLLTGIQTIDSTVNM